MKRRAVIDLGTNTFNLLIADVGSDNLHVMHHEKLPVMLGMGGINHGVIVPEAMDRAKNALRQFVSTCRNWNTTDVIGMGTSALRGASNSSELLEFAQQELGITVHIISGMEEAEYIYRGVLTAHAFSGPAMIMDIGGGSTEFILADESGVQWSASFDIGVSRIYQSLGHPDEFTGAHIQQIRDFLELQCGEALAARKVAHLIGSSGTFETFYEMIYQKTFPDVDHSVDLPMTGLKQILEWSVRSGLQDRMDNPWIVPMRKRMLPVSAVKVQWVLERLEIEQVSVSPFSLKEGVLAEGI